MSDLPSRAAVVWTATDPDTCTEHAKALVDYCERAQLDIAAFAALPEALAMLADGLCDCIVVAHYADLHNAGIHVAAEWVDRPMPVRRAEPVTNLRTRRPRVIGGAR